MFSNVQMKKTADLTPQLHIHQLVHVLTAAEPASRGSDSRSHHRIAAPRHEPRSWETSSLFTIRSDERRPTTTKSPQMM